MVGPSKTVQSQLNYNWLKIETFEPKFDEIYYFYQQYQPLYDVLLEKIENLEFVQSVDVEFVDTLKNNDTKYL